MANSERWNSRRPGFGWITIFKEPAHTPEPQPASEGQGPPYFSRSAIGVMDWGNERDGGMGIIRRKWDSLWGSFYEGMTDRVLGSKRFVIDILHNRIIL